MIGYWCDNIVLNAHTPTEDKSDGTMNNFYNKFHKKILLGDFSVKLVRGAIFGPTVGSGNLLEIGIDYKVSTVNFIMSKKFQEYKVLMLQHS